MSSGCRTTWARSDSRMSPAAWTFWAITNPAASLLPAHPLGPAYVSVGF